MISVFHCIWVDFKKSQSGTCITFNSFVSSQATVALLDSAAFDVYVITNPVTFISVIQTHATQSVTLHSLCSVPYRAPVNTVQQSYFRLLQSRWQLIFWYHISYDVIQAELESRTFPNYIQQLPKHTSMHSPRKARISPVKSGNSFNCLIGKTFCYQQIQ